MLSKLSMKIANHSQVPAAGFSLIEMLMVVSLLGIMTSLAIAWYGGDGSSVRQARDQQNAQSICSLCQVISAAGLNLADETTSSLEIAKKVSQGITIEQGALKGRTFQVPNLGSEELEGAARYLSVRNGRILYEVSGKSSSGETNPSGEI